jgi:hypothetical protein
VWRTSCSNIRKPRRLDPSGLQSPLPCQSTRTSPPPASFADNKDGLISVSATVHRALKDAGIPHLWDVDEYGHDRESRAENRFDFSRRLFR